jgi:hypothetical protein
VRLPRLESVAAEEESREAGSLQLGGEPEEANPPRSRQTRESHGLLAVETLLFDFLAHCSALDTTIWIDERWVIFD